MFCALLQYTLKFNALWLYNFMSVYLFSAWIFNRLTSFATNIKYNYSSSFSGHHQRCDRSHNLCNCKVINCGKFWKLLWYWIWHNCLILYRIISYIYVCRKVMTIFFNEIHSFKIINEKTICMEAFYFWNFIHLYYDFKGPYLTYKG